MSGPRDCFPKFYDLSGTRLRLRQPCWLFFRDSTNENSPVGEFARYPQGRLPTSDTSSSRTLQGATKPRGKPPGFFANRCLPSPRLDATTRRMRACSTILASMARCDIER